MKTNVIMKRAMGDFKISQRTKDGMFNSTELIKQWNESKGLKGRKGKRIDDFLKLESTKSFLSALQEEIDNTEDHRYSKTLQSSRGKNGGTWMHPYLFIDFAMWLNPKFKIKVIKFVYDQLIQFRNEAGDNYKILSNSGKKLKGYNYPEVAKALQWIVFDKTGKGLRNSATQEQLNELKEIQKKLAYAIDLKLITNYNQLIKHLRDLYKNKYETNKHLVNQ